MVDIKSAVNTAGNAAATQVKSFVIPFVVGIFVVALLVGFVPALKKYIA
jgi:t-SNARE complex subunit (syntaxin)